MSSGVNKWTTWGFCPLTACLIQYSWWSTYITCNGSNNPADLNETTYPVCLSGHPQEEVENDEDDQRAQGPLDIQQKIEEPFLLAVKETLGDRYTANMEHIYRKMIKFILETLEEGFTND